MNILITGASGFIGKKIIQKWADADVKMIGLSRHPDVSIEKVTWIQSDILNFGKLEKVFKENQIDAVIHLAAITEHDAITAHKFEMFEINLAGTMNVLKCFNKYCHQAFFLYASTGKVYGETDRSPITEHALNHPTNVLGKSKWITEQVIDYYTKKDNQYLICRIFNIYGEHQKSNFLIPTIIRQLDAPKMVLGSMTDRRDYLYVDDLVSAFRACILHREKFAHYDVVNIGSGESHNVKEIIEMIQNILHKTFNIGIDETKFRQDETSEELCSNTKIQAITGWTPQYSLFEGLYQTMKKEGLLP